MLRANFHRFVTGAFLLFLPSFSSFLSTPGDLIKKLERYLSFYTPEKVYLHTDKPYYSAGDTVWFAAYLAHGVSHMASAPSKIVYVELINEKMEVLARRDIKIAAGTGTADFALTDTLAGGNYLLRGYTSFMRNFEQAYFFHKELRIAGLGDTVSLTAVDAALRGPPLDSTSVELAELFTVRFFPEGGDLVEGLWSTVGVKITGPDGRGIDATGEIVNSENSKAADFQTGGLGMGRLRFFPEAGETYRAKIKFGSRVIEKPFPKARNQGYVMAVSNLASEQLAIRVEGSQPIKGGYLLAHVRGQVFLNLEANGEVMEVLVPKKDLPEGIATFTWFDSQDRPQCERLVFIEPATRAAELKVSGLKASYKRREKVAVSLHSATQSVLSVAVTDKAKLYHQPGDENIRSYLLLNSDLRGEIENSGLYFDPENKKRLQDLDNLLLTQGWRRFSWKDLIEDKKPEINYLAEPEGFSVAGRVVDFYNQKKPVQTTVTLTATNKGGGVVGEETHTDSLGNFLFASLDFADTSNIILQTPNERKMARNGGKKEFVEGGAVNLSTTILFTAFKSPDIEYQFEQDQTVGESEFFAEYLKEVRKVKEIEAAFGFGKDVQVLEGIEVRDFRSGTRERFERAGMMHGIPTYRIDVEAISKTLLPSTFLDIIQMGKVAGVILTGSGIMSRDGLAEYFLDGTRLTDNALETINSIPPTQIDFIDVLRGPQASIYGSRFAIMVYTKRESLLQGAYAAQGVESLTHPGYYHARQFYTPDYSTKKESHVKPDIRPTLYWKAGLTTTDGAPAGLEFYTSDVASIFEVRIEGITEDGRPFVKTEEFVVN